MGGVRKKMSEYMKELKTKTGYISLKEEYLNAPARRQEQNMDLYQTVDMDKWRLEEEESGEDASNASATSFVPPFQRRTQKIEELSAKVVLKEKEIIPVRKENLQSENRSRKSKDILEAQIKTIIKTGEIGIEACNLTAKIYASFIKKEDSFKDENGQINIKKDFF